MLFSKNEEITLANFKRWADNKSVINVKVDDNWVKAEAEDKATSERAALLRQR